MEQFHKEERFRQLGSESRLQWVELAKNGGKQKDLFD